MVREIFEPGLPRVAARGSIRACILAGGCVRAHPDCVGRIQRVARWCGALTKPTATQRHT